MQYFNMTNNPAVPERFVMSEVYCGLLFQLSVVGLIKSRLRLTQNAKNF